ncbi:MAG TPA: choice-of-anchor T family protein [Candidatus Thermoplasmatota archaeon]
MIVLTSAFSILAEPAVAQNPVPALSFTIAPSERHAVISPSQPGTASFTGNYTVDKLNVERAVVTFNAVVSTGWPVTISPSVITISGTAGRTGSIYITVVVPPGELATNIGTLTVTGRAVAGGLQSPAAQATAIIVPEPYFRVVIQVDTPFIETSYSTQAVISLKVYNEGNVKDTIRIDIQNIEELSEKQWFVVLTRQSFQVEPPPGFANIQISVGLPKQWQAWPDNKVQTIQIIASSQEAVQNNKQFVDVIPVFVRTVGLSTPGFDVPIAILGAVLAAMFMGASRRKRRA